MSRERMGLGRVGGWYGAGPLHFLVLVASFALAGYGAVRLVPDEPVKVTVWFIGAVIGHDLILFPLYALADRSVTTILDRRRAGTGGTGGHVRAAINYIRVPVLATGLLLLVWFPLIFGLDDSSYRAATGQTTDVYLGRFLALAGVIFLTSAVVYAVNLRRSTTAHARTTTT